MGSSDGKPYYWKADTQETQWERPRGSCEAFDGTEPKAPSSVRLPSREFSGSENGSEPESDGESTKPSPKKLKTKRRKPRGAGKSSRRQKRHQTLKRQKPTVKKTKSLKAPRRKLRKGKPKVTRR